MIDFLLAVPGKLTTIYSHLTTYLSSTRCAKIDNLDAAMSTRAAAATAVSSANYTSALATHMGLTEKPPIASGLITPDSLSGISASSSHVSALQRICDSISAGTHSYTGSGVLNMVAQANSTGAGVAATCTITIDGNAVYTFSSTILADSTQPHVGVASENWGFTFDQVPFRDSISIAATGLTVYFKYRKTS